MQTTLPITISFDFDGTLAESEELQEYCKKIIAVGHTVKILTRRYGPDSDFKDDEHTYVYFVAKELGIKIENVHFSNRKWKYEKINDLQIQAHIDDDDMDIRYIKTFTKCATIPFNQVHDWKKNLDDILSEKFITFEQ